VIVPVLNLGVIVSVLILGVIVFASAVFELWLFSVAVL
jgi:hypothetical protein